MHPSQRIYCTKIEKLKGRGIVPGITGRAAAVGRGSGSMHWNGHRTACRRERVYLRSLRARPSPQGTTASLGESSWVAGNQ